MIRSSPARSCSRCRPASASDAEAPGAGEAPPSRFGGRAPLRRGIPQTVETAPPGPVSADRIPPSGRGIPRKGQPDLAARRGKFFSGVNGLFTPSVPHRRTVEKMRRGAASAARGPPWGRGIPRRKVAGRTDDPAPSVNGFFTPPVLHPLTVEKGRPDLFRRVESHPGAEKYEEQVNGPLPVAGKRTTRFRAAARGQRSEGKRAGRPGGVAGRSRGAVRRTVIRSYGSPAHRPRTSWMQ